MNSSLYIGYTGSLSNTKAMDILGNNIANINTTGYKANNAEFSTLFETYLSQTPQNPVYSDKGFGSRISSTAIDTSQGTLRESESVFNMAISGDGWFGVVNDNTYNANDISFTRDGTFTQNRDGYIINGSGNFLLGSDYGLVLEQEDGSFIIDDSAAAISPASEVGKQSAIFAPKELYYPHTVTTTASLQKNLYTQSATQNKSASSNTDMQSLLNSSGELMDIKENQDLLFSVGTNSAVYKNGAIEYTIKTPNDTDSVPNSLSFNLNGTQIDASWQEGDSSGTIAANIKSAIEASGIDGISIEATTDGLKIISSDSITISDSDSHLINNSFVSRISYSQTESASDKFSTMSDFSQIVENGINEVYGTNSADVFIDSSGNLKVASKETTIELEFKSASDSNEKLLTNLSPLNTEIPKDSIYSSKDFNIASTTSSQKIIDENGDENLIFVELNQLTPKTKDSNSTWEAAVKIVKNEPATELSNANELTLNDKDIELKENQDMWISVGNGDIRKTAFGYDYAIKAPYDIPDGTDSTLSFEVNGTQVDVTITDGMSSYDSAEAIALALNEQGIDATANYDEVYIHATDTNPTLTIKNAQSSIEDFSMPNHTLTYAKYASSDENSFLTLEDINSLINDSAADAGLLLTASIEDSKFKIQNDSNEEVKYKVLSGVDSNSALLDILTPTNDPIQPSSSATTAALQTMTLLSQTTQNISFNDTSELEDGTTVTIKNGETDLVLDLSGMTNYTDTINQEFFTQNGRAQEDFEFYDIDQDGQLIANFSNGSAVALSKVSVYHFQNDQGLEKIGDNLFMQSSNSGNPFFYVDSEGAVFEESKIFGKMLENSNVNTGNALSEMIVLQRAFESTAKIITTSDELLKNAINMKK
ncbi:MAG: flagellar hook protein FlgE [Campylobacterota bacterium]|nr:flagellar hook protein FlgE [Campylobacterota bacterium]